MGPTNSIKARETAPESLRALYGKDGSENGFHGSDSVASAERELGLIFPELSITFAFIKPDVVKAGKEQDALARIRAGGFEVLGEKTLTLSQEQAEEFYGEHKGKPFFEGLVGFMTSGPAVALALKKPNAIQAWRAFIGPTDSNKARETAPESLRATFGTDGRQNAFHGSDSVASAQRELALIFPELKL